MANKNGSRHERMVIRTVRACNFACEYCIAKAAVDGQCEPAPVDDIVQIVKKHKIRAVTFNGPGESTLSPNFVETVLAIAPLVKRVEVLSNVSAHPLSWWEDLIMKVHEVSGGKTLFWIVNSVHFGMDNFIDNVKLKKLTENLNATHNVQVQACTIAILGRSSIPNFIKHYDKYHARLSDFWGNIHFVMDYNLTPCEVAEIKKALGHRLDGLSFDKLQGFAQYEKAPSSSDDCDGYGCSCSCSVGDNDNDELASFICECDFNTLNLLRVKDGTLKMFDVVPTFKVNTFNLAEEAKIEKYERLIVRPSRSCDLNCPYCNQPCKQGVVSKIPIGAMIELLEKHYLREVTFGGLKETTLSPNLKEAFAEASKHVDTINIFTNGSSQSIEWWEDLLTSAPKNVQVSVYHSYHFSASNGFSHNVKLYDLIHTLKARGWNIVDKGTSVLSKHSIDNIIKCYDETSVLYPQLWKHLGFMTDYFASDADVSDMMKQLGDRARQMAISRGYMRNTSDDNNGSIVCEYDFNTLELQLQEDGSWDLLENLDEFVQRTIQHKIDSNLFTGDC